MVVPGSDIDPFFAAYKATLHRFAEQSESRHSDHHAEQGHPPIHHRRHPTHANSLRLAVRVAGKFRNLTESIRIVRSKRNANALTQKYGLYTKGGTGPVETISTMIDKNIMFVSYRKPAKQEAHAPPRPGNEPAARRLPITSGRATCFSSGRNFPESDSEECSTWKNTGCLNPMSFSKRATMM